MAINPVTWQEEVLWYDPTQVWIPWVNMATPQVVPPPTPQVATTWTTPQNPPIMTPQPVQQVVQPVATPPQPTTKAVEQKPIEVPTSIDEWKKQGSNMWTLEQMIEKSYWTVATNKNGVLQANIWGVDYQWNIDQAWNPIKTKVWGEDPQLIFNQLMAWKKFDNTGIQTTPEYYKAKARYDIASQYMWMWEEQLYNAYLNWDISPELEKDLIWNPYLAIAKDKVNKKTVTDSINKESVVMLNAYNKANNDKYTPVTVQKTPLEILSDKFMSSFESMWKWENEIKSFKDYMQTNYPNIVTDSLKLNAKTQELQKLTDQRDARLDEIIKENPWISINRATMLASRQNKDINAQIQSMGYEIQNLSANLKYQTELADKNYSYDLAEQQRKDAIEKEKRTYLYQQIEKQQELEASQAQAEAKQKQQEFENTLKLQELQSKLSDRKTTLLKDDATWEQRLIDSQTWETIQSFKTGLKPETMTPYQKAQAELDKKKYELDLKKFEAEQAWWGSTISWNINFTVTPWTTNNRPDRNNNPWNVKWGQGIWKDDQGHTIFATPEQWYQAMIDDLTAKQTWNSKQVSKITGKKLWPDSTLADLWSVYAQDPKWSNWVSKLSWYSLNTKLKDIDINKLAPAIARQEWFTWTIWTWQKQYTESQKNLMNMIDTKSISKIEETQLKKAWLWIQDVANYKTANPKADTDTVLKIRTHFDALPEVKDWDTAQWVKEWLKTAKSWNLSWPDIQWLVSNYAKILDPTSVVRESEYAMAQSGASQWVIDKTKQQIATFIAWWSNVLSKDAQWVLVKAMQKRLDAMESAYLNKAKQEVKRTNALGIPLTIEQLTWEQEVQPQTDTTQANKTESTQFTSKSWKSYNLNDYK